ncbi:hypothetical protein HC256_008073 [Beauveria bassiana]|nr:hypothetical protein HC256_008073 [Beauveria bassiana]
MCPLATCSRRLVGFALGYYTASIAQYAADLRVMTEAYTAVHKMLFSVAYAQLLVDMPLRRRRRAEGGDFVQRARLHSAVRRRGQLHVFGAGRGFFLGFVAVLTLLLLLLLRVCRGKRLHAVRGEAVVAAGQWSSWRETAAAGSLQDVFSCGQVTCKTRSSG